LRNLLRAKHPLLLQRQPLHTTLPLPLLLLLACSPAAATQYLDGRVSSNAEPCWLEPLPLRLFLWLLLLLLLRHCAGYLLLLRLLLLLGLGWLQVLRLLPRLLLLLPV
jgi:hypothetical protein